jgi:hypothetical protein
VPAASLAKLSDLELRLAVTPLDGAGVEKKSDNGVAQDEAPGKVATLKQKNRLKTILDIFPALQINFRIGILGHIPTGSRVGVQGSEKNGHLR